MRTLSGNNCQEMGGWSCTVVSGVCRDSLFQFKAGGVRMQIEDKTFICQSGIKYIQRSRHHILILLLIKHVMQMQNHEFIIHTQPPPSPSQVLAYMLIAHSRAILPS
jgi:hypothetical protein